MTLIWRESAQNSEHAIVYVERADGDGERVAAFSGFDRKRALAFAMWCESEGNEVLTVLDDAAQAWPEILDDFASHARTRRQLLGAFDWYGVRLSRCPRRPPFSGRHIT